MSICHSMQPKEHDDMSVTPAYLMQDSDALTYEDGREPCRHVGSSQDAASFARLEGDGATFKKIYLADAQRIFSRVQHHMHKRTKKGYIPLKSCMKKGKKGCLTCKADFPKTKLCLKKSVIICRGIAKRLGLRVSGICGRNVH